MTPPRLSEIECPDCRRATWILDCDYRGADMAGGIELAYPERTYACPGCGRSGPGWVVKQQSPAEFLLQPHDLYPMTRADFDHWVVILRTHFPDHPMLAELEKSFFPRIPGEFRPRPEYRLTGQSRWRAPRRMFGLLASMLAKVGFSRARTGTTGTGRAPRT